MKKYSHLDRVVETLPDDIQVLFRTYVLTGENYDEYKLFQKEHLKIATEAEEHALGLMIAAFHEVYVGRTEKPESESVATSLDSPIDEENT